MAQSDGGGELQVASRCWDVALTDDRVGGDFDSVLFDPALPAFKQQVVKITGQHLTTDQSCCDQVCDQVCLPSPFLFCPLFKPSFGVKFTTTLFHIPQETQKKLPTTGI